MFSMCVGQEREEREEGEGGRGTIRMCMDVGGGGRDVSRRVCGCGGVIVGGGRE